MACLTPPQKAQKTTKMVGFADTFVSDYVISVEIIPLLSLQINTHYQVMLIDEGFYTGILEAIVPFPAYIRKAGVLHLVESTLPHLEYKFDFPLPEGFKQLHSLEYGRFWYCSKGEYC